MSRRSSYRRADTDAVVFVALSVLGVVGAFVLIDAGLRAMPLQLMVYAVLTLIVAIIGLGGALFGVARPRPLMTTFFIFCFFWFGLSPFFSYALGRWPTRGSYADDRVVLAYQLTLCGIAAYVLFYLVGARTAPKLPRTERARAQMEPSHPERRLALLALVACSLSLALWIRFGGLSLTFASRNEAARLVHGGDGETASPSASIAVAVMRVPPALLMLTTIAVRPAIRGRFGRTVLPALLLLLNLLVSSPLSTPRQWVGAVAVGLLFVALRDRRSLRLAVLGLVAVVAFAYPAFNGFRRGSELGLDGVGLVETLGARPDFDVMATTMDATSAVEETGVQGGRQLLAALTFYVPRSVWPDKPPPSGEYIFDNSPTNRYRHSNMSVSLWAEGYIDFGAVGTVTYLGLLGFASARLEWRSNDRRTGGAREAVLVPLLAGFQFILLRGALLPVMSTVVAIAVSYRIVVWAVGRSGPWGCLEPVGLDAVPVQVRSLPDAAGRRPETTVAAR